MVKVCTDQDEIPNNVLNTGDLTNWEYIIIPESPEDKEKAKIIALMLAGTDYRKFTANDGSVFYITYYE